MIQEGERSKYKKKNKPACTHHASWASVLSLCPSTYLLKIYITQVRSVIWSAFSSTTHCSISLHPQARAQHRHQSPDTMFSYNTQYPPHGEYYGHSPTYRLLKNRHKNFTLSNLASLTVDGQCVNNISSPRLIYKQVD